MVTVLMARMPVLAPGRSLADFGHLMFNRLFQKARRRGICYDPYDRTVRERLADRMFALHQHDERPGTVGRGQLILDIIQDSFPTEALAAAYFDNLELLLKPREPRRAPGQVMLGLGTGRSGSTSLVAVLTTIEGSCCTHENPPLISWTPETEELQFHIKRFRRLSEYFPLVVDVSHWWLNVLDHFFTHFPDGKVVGMFRNLESCVNSFMKIKGFGPGSYNHWVPYGNGIWAAAQWDPTYPTYTVPENSQHDPDGAKFELIARYVREYNERLHALAARSPERIMLVKTEQLNEAAVQRAIFDFAGMRGCVAKTQLNVGATSDGAKFDYKF
jgi:hypothetical protein